MVAMSAPSGIPKGSVTKNTASTLKDSQDKEGGQDEDQDQADDGDEEEDYEDDGEDDDEDEDDEEEDEDKADKKDQVVTPASPAPAKDNFAFGIMDPDWDSVIIYSLDARLEKVCAVCRRQHPRDTLWRMCTCTHVLMHKACMERYLQQEMISSCESCLRPYPVEWTPRYSAPRAFWLWITGHADTCEIILMLYLPFLLACEALLKHAFLGGVLREVLAASHHGTVRGFLQNFSEEIDHRYWTLFLVLAVFHLEAVFLGVLGVRNLTSFSRWYRGTFAATLLEPPVPEKERGGDAGKAS